MMTKTKFMKTIVLPLCILLFAFCLFTALAVSASEANGDPCATPDCTGTYENGKCLVCGTQMAASLTKAGDTPVVTYYTTLEEAITAAKSADGSTITLFDDCILSTNGYTIIESNVCLDLNGNNIIGNAYQYILIQNNVTVTIMDDSTTPGSLSAKTNLKNSTLVIRGGNYAPISASTGSTLQIYGGEFEQVSVISDASAEIYGGSYAKLEINYRTGDLSDILPKDHYIYDANKQIVNAGAVEPNKDNTDYYTVENVTVEYGAVITEDMITVADVVYNGEKQLPLETINVGGVVLTRNEDYTVSLWSDEHYHIGAGEWEFFIWLDKNPAYTYNGEKIRMVQTIHKATPKVTLPTAISGLVYNGAEQELVSAGSTTGGTLMYKVDDGDWNSTCPEVTKAGTYTVSYKVLGGTNFEDVAEQSIEVTIAPKNASAAAITLEGDTFSYNGAAQTPDLTILLDGVTLTAGTDYTVAWSDNRNVGTATAAITFIGNYTGTAETTFEITLREVAAPTFDGLEEYYLHTGEAIEPTFTLKDDLENTIPADEYTVTYSNNTDFGMATVTITDKEGGNYTVSGTATFEVHQHEWNDGEITTAPTCSAKGVETFTCQKNSAHTYTEDVDALGHKYDHACDSDCNTCGAERTPAEHVDADENNACDECGAELPGDGLGAGSIAAIVIGSVAVVGLGGFAIVRFGIRNKKKGNSSVDDLTR